MTLWKRQLLGILLAYYLPTYAGTAFHTIVVHSGTQLMAKNDGSKLAMHHQKALTQQGKTLHVRGKGATIAQIPYPIHKIILENNANAYFDQIKTKNLTVINKGSGHLAIHAKKVHAAVLRNLGKGTIDIYAIDTPTLNITGFNGTLHLAGNATHMHTKLTGQALLNAKHLRTHHTWIRTQENAAALIQPNNSLNAYAINNSQIAYTNRLPDQSSLIETHNLANVFYAQMHPTDRSTLQQQETKKRKQHRPSGKFKPQA